MTISERLGTLDASFLELEDANDAAHMHIDAVMVFEARPQGPPPLEERSELGRRIEQLPHYRSRRLTRTHPALRDRAVARRPALARANVHSTRGALTAAR